MLYKQQRKCLQKRNFLNKSDFVLVLHTAYQAIILKEFSNNVANLYVAIGSTFKTIATGYDFALITIVAWCIMSKEDQKLVHLFFKSLKIDMHGMVTPQ